MIRALILSLAAMLALPAAAHSPSNAFVDLSVDGPELAGHWEVALRDLVVLADLDADRDGRLSWGELSGARAALAATLTDRLGVQADGTACTLRLTDLLLNDRADGRYAWFELAGRCPAAPTALTLDYALLAAIDPTHRGIVVLRAGDVTQSLVLTPGAGERRVELARPALWESFIDYLREGVWHIWIGFDHILFLLALLLPAVLRYRDGAWQPVRRLRPALVHVAGVVTAFTVAHSVTLSLAVLGVLQVPIALVEALIAASVIAAALNNVVPVVVRAHWLLAFGFGLIHGFGFASVLGELGLPESVRALALIGFNVGVEAGQLAIVLVVVPLAFVMRRTAFYRTGLRVYGSLAVAVLAAIWLVERSGVLDIL